MAKDAAVRAPRTEELGAAIADFAPLDGLLTLSVPAKLGAASAGVRACSSGVWGP
ncbi:hypothetical protein [Amycolatopsis palatopharyngis]|uniref:hypothetical protein n=1 Tax=Amycolatopsis palatopharyngis TaxID=187982 RepID=UPI001FE3B1F3|nr:hypothetical protein [Amycolatopsis palatopharyngis]